MREAFIVSAVRTAGGRRNGRLAGWHPVDLGAAVLDAALARAGVLGGAGCMNEYLVARLWRDARVTRIFGGTDEIMKEVVGRAL